MTISLRGVLELRGSLEIEPLLIAAFSPVRFLQAPLPELAALVLLLCVYITHQQLRRRRQNELFRIVSENAADMIALVDVTGKRLYNSPSYEKVLGYIKTKVKQDEKEVSFDEFNELMKAATPAAS